MPTVKLQKSTLARLEKHGQFKDTWDTLIIRILDRLEENAPAHIEENVLPGQNEQGEQKAEILKESIPDEDGQNTEKAERKPEVFGFRLSRKEVQDLEESIKSKRAYSMSREYEQAWLQYKKLGENYPFRN